MFTAASVFFSERIKKIVVDTEDPIIYCIDCRSLYKDINRGGLIREYVLEGSTELLRLLY